MRRVEIGEPNRRAFRQAWRKSDRATICMPASRAKSTRRGECRPRHGRVPAAAIFRRETTGQPRLSRLTPSPASVIDHRVVDVGRIGLDREFIASASGCQLQHDSMPTVEAASASDMSACRHQNTAFPLRAAHPESRQLNVDRPQIVADQVVAAGYEREIAVAAPMPTERHMNICGPWYALASA